MSNDELLKPSFDEQGSPVKIRHGRATVSGERIPICHCPVRGMGRRNSDYDPQSQDICPFESTIAYAK